MLILPSYIVLHLKQASDETSNDKDKEKEKDHKTSEVHDAQRPRHALPARPPSPKRSKQGSSLFLKSKPMSMKVNCQID